MKTMKKWTIAGLMATSMLAGAASADSLSGDLKIFLDTSNPAPRATMEAMIADFQEMHPELSIETTVIDREAYKTQIRNFLTADAPDVATWYAANRMKPYVDAGLFEDVSDVWQDPEIAENLASTKGAMTIDDKQWGAIPVLISWALQGLTAGLIVLGYVLVYQQIENYWLSPKISSDTMTLNGGVAFGAALAGGAIAGPMGAFTALPVAALISSFISNYYASNEVVYHSEAEEIERQAEALRESKKRKKDED